MFIHPSSHKEEWSPGVCGWWEEARQTVWLALTQDQFKCPWYKQWQVLKFLCSLSLYEPFQLHWWMNLAMLTQVLTGLWTQAFGTWVLQHKSNFNLKKRQRERKCYSFILLCLFREGLAHADIYTPENVSTDPRLQAYCCCPLLSHPQLQ